MWKAFKKPGSDEYLFNGLKLDVSIANSDLMTKSKFQILKGLSPKLVIVNEKSKLLLLYEISQ